MYTNKTNNSSSTPIPYSNLCTFFFHHLVNGTHKSKSVMVN